MAMAIGAAPPQPWSSVLVLGALVALWCAWRVVMSAWIRPRRLGRVMQEQGLRGTSYRFPFGDLKEFARLVAEARFKPMPLTQAITARVACLYYNVIKEHGKVILNDPKLVRELLANKCGHFEKRTFPAIVNRLANGLVSLDGEKWATHRRIINPAFHLEKLKKMMPPFDACSDELVARWENHVGSDGQAKEIDVWPELQNLTGDVISCAAFGGSFSEGKRIFQIQSEQAQNVVKIANTLYLTDSRFLPTKLNKRMIANAREVEALLRLERDNRQEGEGHERGQRQQRRSVGGDDGVQHGRDQAGLERQIGHDHGRYHRGAEALLLRGDGHDRGAAHMDDGGAQRAPRVAGPRQGGGAARLRQQPARLRRDKPAQSCDDYTV